NLFHRVFVISCDKYRHLGLGIAGRVEELGEDAVEKVSRLVVDAGFAVEKTGGLDAAKLLEPRGMLNIRLGYGLGRGTAIAPAWRNLAA
ncbi:oxidoreductase, partial [Rhizobium leguminosarum]